MPLNWYAGTNILDDPDLYHPENRARRLLCMKLYGITIQNTVCNLKTNFHSCYMKDVFALSLSLSLYMKV
jgi:hypothetical protein